MEKDRGAVRVDALTGVRIIAALGVFLSHTPGPASLPQPIRTSMASGYNGVTLFFVLSGFVLTWNYIDRLTPLTLRGVWSFGVARFSRVYPLYICALLFAVSQQLVLGGTGKTIWAHIFALQAWLPDLRDSFTYNSPGWSIGVEFFLYACLPLLIVLLVRIRHSPRALLLVVAACVLVGLALAWWFIATGRAALPWESPQSAHRWLYRTPLTRLGDFTVGIVAALLILNARARASTARAAQALGVVGFLGFMAWPAMLLTAWSWDVAYLLPSFLLLWGLAAGQDTRFARFLASKPMVLAGEASFAFYIIHKPMLDYLHFDGVNGWERWAFTTAIQFTVILLTAFGAHIVIERPAQRWLRRKLDPPREVRGQVRERTAPVL